MRPAIPVLLPAGCLILPAYRGDDEGDAGGDDANTGTLSVQDYRERMNRLCREAEAAAKKQPEPDSLAEIVGALPRLADFMEKGNATARKLGLSDCVAEPISPDQREPAAS